MEASCLTVLPFPGAIRCSLATQPGQGRSCQSQASRDQEGKPIGQQPSLSRHKVEQIRAELQKGTGILKTACCAGPVSAVQRIKATMKQTV
jgi:hypothetical protein